MGEFYSNMTCVFIRRYGDKIRICTEERPSEDRAEEDIVSHGKRTQQEPTQPTP